MKLLKIAALVVAASSTIAFADNSLSAKAKMDHPGVKFTGSTINPTSKPDDQGLASKAMRDHPAVGR